MSCDGTPRDNKVWMGIDPDNGNRVIKSYPSIVATQPFYLVPEADLPALHYGREVLALRQKYAAMLTSGRRGELLHDIICEDADWTAQRAGELLELAQAGACLLRHALALAEAQGNEDGDVDL